MSANNSDNESKTESPSDDNRDESENEDKTSAQTTAQTSSQTSEREINETQDTSSMMERLRQFFVKNLRLDESESDEKVERLLEEVSINGVINYIKSGKCNNIIAMVGAGISTSAGIPDFRSPESGLYSKLAKYNLPSPECMFDINFFRENPRPFFELAKELFPGKFKPTLSHYFLKLLEEKNLLLRVYTQNIDTLERVAGISGEKLVEAHGTFHTSHCINKDCRKQYTLEFMKEKIFSDEIIPKCDLCESTVKPDIVFFGERLPNRFFNLVEEDFEACDLLIIIGTSLTVQPFAGLIENVSPKTPRLLINKTKAGQQTSQLSRYLGINSGMNFDSEKNYRDVLCLTDCDEGCLLLATGLDFDEELNAMIKNEHKKIDAQS